MKSLGRKIEKQLKMNTNQEITSPQNEKFRLWKSLDDSKEIKSNQLCLVSGKKLTDELSKTELPVSLLVPKGEKPDWEIEGKKYSTFFLSKDLFAELDQFNSRSPLLVCKTPSILPYESGPPNELEIIIATGDPSNCGAIIRSSVGFNANKIILTEDSASPFLPKSIRASSGAVFNARLFKAHKPTSLAPYVFLDMTGESIYKYKWPKNIRLYLGQEGKGISKDLLLNPSTKKLSIPTTGVESLNVVVAGSIALSHYRSIFS